MRPTIAPIVVVEGVHDADAVARAVQADTLCTGGFAFGTGVEARLRRAHAARGLVVLTDPDPAGEQIRQRVEVVAGPCAHARLHREDCRRGRRVGVEYASVATIREALAQARGPARPEGPPRFTTEDLWQHGLVGGPGAQQRRAEVGARLGLGFGNARQLLRRLNALGVTREEFDTAVRG